MKHLKYIESNWYNGHFDDESMTVMHWDSDNYGYGSTYENFEILKGHILDAEHRLVEYSKAKKQSDMFLKKYKATVRELKRLS